MFVGQFVNSLITFAVGILVARYLGPANYGILNYVISFVALFAPLVDLGLKDIVIRDIVNDPRRKDICIGSAFALKFVAAAITLLFVISLTSTTEKDTLTRWMIWILAGAYFIQSLNVISFYFYAFVKAKFIVYAQIVRLFISALVKLIFIITEAELINFIYLIVAESVIEMCLLLVFYYREKQYLARWKVDRETVKLLLKNSWPLIFSGLAISIYMKIDQVMLKYMAGAEELGNYAIAVKLSEIWYVLPVLITNSVYPGIVSLRKSDEKRFNTRIQLLFDMFTLSSLAISIGITFVAHDLIKLFYGTQYQTADGIVMIYIWSTLFVFSGTLSQKWFLTENLQIIGMLTTTVGMIINVLLNFILIPQMGGRGAAIATVVSYSLTGILFNFFFKKTRKIFFVQLKSLNILHYFRRYSLSSFRNG